MRLLKKAALAAVLAGMGLAPARAGAADKPVISSPSDLPPVRFPFATAPSDALMTSALLAMLPALKVEGERLLRDYDIRDPSILTQLRMGLASIAILDGRKGDADRLIADYRAAQTKPQQKAIGGLNTDLAAAIAGAAGSPGCDAGAARMQALLADADATVVRDQFLQSFSDIQTASPAYYVGTAAGFADPIAKQRGSLGIMEALALVRFRVAATMLPPCRAALTAVARRWLDDPAHRPTDIWPARQPADTAFTGARPVVVAVWDRGFDTTLFPGQLAHDPAEPLDGHDNDGNGVIDDIGGPTWDVTLRPRDAAMAAPTRFLQARLAAQMAYDKGELDLGYGLDTPEAALFADFTRTASAAAQGEELFASLENHGRVHGTACASEIADGAPYVRLYNVAALPWGQGEDKLPIAYDEATIGRWAAAIDRIGTRMRGAGVRVVSMSWGLTADEITQQLLDRGLERDQARARSRGIAMQATIRRALEAMMRASPDILFVIAAGNSNQSDDIQADAVQQFSLPNMLIVGATGANGRPTAFTVFGPSVGIYAQGEAVRLRWPGDIVLHQSGTSMAAPLVARAAAQMLAVRPTLHAAQVRDGLLASATAGEGGLKLLHPAAAVAWAQAAR